MWQACTKWGEVYRTLCPLLAHPHPPLLAHSRCRTLDTEAHAAEQKVYKLGISLRGVAAQRIRGCTALHCRRGMDSEGAQLPELIKAACLPLDSRLWRWRTMLQLNMSTR